MLVTLLSWIYIGAFCLGAGLLVRGALGRFFAVEKNPERMSVTGTMMFGFVGITVYAEWFSLFAGVGALCHLLLLAVVVFYIVRSRWAREVLGGFLRRGRMILFTHRADTGRICQSGQASEGADAASGTAGTSDIRERRSRGGLWRLTAAGWFLLVFVLVCAFFTSRGSFHTDTGIYHAQAIRILEDYGVIKGLANLQLHFGYNSSYLVFCAFFTLRWLTGTALHTTTGFLMALLGCHAFYGLRAPVRHRRHGADAMRIALLVYILTNLTGAMSPATDYGTMLFILYLFIAFFEAFESRPSHGKNTTARPAAAEAAAPGKRTAVDADSSMEPDVRENREEIRLTAYGMIAMGGLFAVSMKLSAAAVFLLAVYPMVCFLKRGQWRTVLKFAALGVALFLPYLVRNVILTGWLFYPFEAIDLFDVEWKVPVEYSLADSQQIKVWGRCLYDIALIDAPLSEWFPVWWESQQHYAQLLIYADVLSVPLFACDVLLAQRKRTRGKIGKMQAETAAAAADESEKFKEDAAAAAGNRVTQQKESGAIRWELVTFILMLYAGLAVWFFSAPFVRYGLAFILALPLLAVGLFAEMVFAEDVPEFSCTAAFAPEDQSGSRGALWKAAGAWLSVLTVLCFGSWLDNYAMDDMVFIKQNLAEPYYIAQKPFDDPEMEAVELGGDVTVYYAVEGELNSYYVTPSTCYHFMLERSELIGETIREGFRAKSTQ